MDTSCSYRAISLLKNEGEAPDAPKTPVLDLDQSQFFLPDWLIELPWEEVERILIRNQTGEINP